MTRTTDTQLTDTQLVLLSQASQRDDGIVPIRERLKGGVATSVGERLMALGLAEERPAEPGQPTWRETTDGERLTLMITRRGLEAIGIREADDNDDPTGEGAPGKMVPASAHDGRADAPIARVGTKKSVVIGMLGAGEGASIADIAEGTGWQAHTIRAFLTGLRKTGTTIETMRKAGGATRYRLVEEAAYTASTMSAEAGPSIPARKA